MKLKEYSFKTAQKKVFLHFKIRFAN
jgi:hypothetical protein